MTMRRAPRSSLPGVSTVYSRYQPRGRDGNCRSRFWNTLPSCRCRNGPPRAINASVSRASAGRPEASGIDAGSEGGGATGDARGLDIGATAFLHARLLVRAGDVDRAVRQYKRAIEDDGSLADSELASQLGIRPGASEAERAGDDVVDGKVRASRTGSDDAPLVDVERPVVGFRDVGGMEELKDEIRMKVIHPLEHQELYKAYGKTVDNVTRLEILTYGGVRMWVGPTSDAELAEILMRRHIAAASRSRQQALRTAPSALSRATVTVRRD